MGSSWRWTHTFAPAAARNRGEHGGEMASKTSSLTLLLTKRDTGRSGRRGLTRNSPGARRARPSGSCSPPEWAEQVAGTEAEEPKAVAEAGACRARPTPGSAPRGGGAANQMSKIGAKRGK